ncbi:dihydrodipicolinate synthase family protein [Granulicella sibirica]|uniref:1-pyrroline-4-hydroxy-2-carboxylate deaminase n=1 Tax=Granulicella sibirica TaxID=2479048 RepID=A0A4Q0STP2_9BACT|nr:dihydrodipicolinate synthase family protein [Granulicella sibirica]RXH54363.1 1-pyrroline-4-hydroxy-2-carboxylate deaminase [Granulicella sibirica]
MIWKGVMPAMTTAFKSDLSLDHQAIAKRAKWMIDSGCTGLILLGSLGEATALTQDEKRTVLEIGRDAVGPNVPVVSAISGLATADTVNLAKMAEKAGADGLMVLPPYVYKGDWREMKAHIAAIFRATDLPCMLYNNPIAYGTDFTPQQIVELANEHPNFMAVKESSTDVRRVTSIQTLLGNRLALFVGVDDAIVEAIAAGATGWVAGLVNAFPEESVRVFNLAMEGNFNEAFALYRWFLPLLRLDTVPKFIQLIKLTEERIGVGTAYVRPPRLELTGAEREEALAIIDASMANRPTLALV